MLTGAPARQLAASRPPNPPPAITTRWRSWARAAVKTRRPPASSICLSCMVELHRSLLRACNRLLSDIMRCLLLCPNADAHRFAPCCVYTEDPAGKTQGYMNHARDRED